MRFRYRFVNVLDHVPADAEVNGHILDRHPPTMLSSILLEAVRKGSAWFRERNLRLADDLANATAHAVKSGPEEDRLRSPRNGLEEAMHLAMTDQIHRAACRAADGGRILPDGEEDLPVNEVCALVDEAADAQGMVQLGRGPGLSSS